jgi:peptide/nickel transport system permease protein
MMSPLKVLRFNAQFPSLRDRSGWVGSVGRLNGSMLFGGSVILVVALLSFSAPYLGLYDPLRQVPMDRLQAPSSERFFGTDMYGRDVFSRVLHGGQISLVIGASVAVLASLIGLFFGILAGFIRKLDAVIMRVFDSLMSIPAILLAIALVALWGSSVTSVILALVIPEVPRVARLVRSVVITLRDQAFVHAAIASGSGTVKIIRKHILPNAAPALIVQATYIAAQAVIFEAYLSFVGAGTPPEVPSWGNIMAQGRTHFIDNMHIILFPGLFLAVTVFAINTFGDGLRDQLDPKMRHLYK